MCGRHVVRLRDCFCVFAVIITIACHALLKSLVSYRPYFSFLFFSFLTALRPLSLRIFHSCIFYPWCLFLIFPFLLLPLLHFQHPRVDVEDDEKETCFGVMNMEDEEQREHETQRHVGWHYSSNILTTSDYRYDLLPRHMMKLLIINDVIN